MKKQPIVPLRCRLGPIMLERVLNDEEITRATFSIIRRCIISSVVVRQAVLMHLEASQRRVDCFDIMLTRLDRLTIQSTLPSLVLARLWSIFPLQRINECQAEMKMISERSNYNSPGSSITNGTAANCEPVSHYL